MVRFGACFFVLLSLCVGVRAEEQENAKAKERAALTQTTTKKGKTHFDVETAVEAFVAKLVEKDPPTTEAFEALLKQAREDAGGRFLMGSWSAIEWEVSEVDHDFKDAAGTVDYQGVYLVKMPFGMAYHHGYARPNRVVAQVSVTRHDEMKANPKKADDYVLTESTLNLHFDGFVEVEVKLMGGPAEEGKK